MTATADTIATLAARAEPAASWMLTYALHSTLLLTAAWLLGRALGDRRLALQEAAWKLALVGGLITASLQLGLGLQPLGGTWSLTPATAATVLETPAPTDLLHTAGISQEVAATAAPAQMAAISGSPGAGSAHLATTPPPAAAGEAAAISGHTLSGTALWPLGAVVAWLAVAALLLASLAVAYLRLARRLADRWPITGKALTALFGRLLDRSGRTRPVRLTTTRRLGIPIAWGVRRGEITLPADLVDGLSPYHQESILAHELAHLLRRDPLWLAAGRLLESALFFQPLNRLARRRLQEIAEYRCDDRAVELTGRPLELARCLTEVAAWRLDGARGLPVSAMAACSGLGARVRRLADRSRQAGDTLPRWVGPAAAALLLLVAVAAPAITGQEAPPPPPAPEVPAVPDAASPGAVPVVPEAPPAPEAAALPEPAAAPTAPALPAVPGSLPSVAPDPAPEALPAVPHVPQVAPAPTAPALAVPRPDAQPAPRPELHPATPPAVPGMAVPPVVTPRPDAPVAAVAAPRPVLVSTAGVETPAPDRDLHGLTSASRAEREAALSRLEAELDTLEARIDDAVERHEAALEAFETRTGEERGDEGWDERLHAGLKRLEQIHDRIAGRLADRLQEPGVERADVRAEIERHLHRAFRAHRALEGELARLHAETVRLSGALPPPPVLAERIALQQRDAAREEARRHMEAARREVEREIARQHDLEQRELERVRAELHTAQRAVERQNRELREQNRELRRMQQEELSALARELAATHRAALEARASGDAARSEELARELERLQEELEVVQERLEERHQEMLEHRLELREQTLEELQERLEAMQDETEEGAEGPEGGGEEPEGR